jgi:ketosteroid isomerase-like protein
VTPGNVTIVRGAYDAFKNGELQYMKNHAAPDFVMKTSSATDGAEHYGPQAIEEISQVISARWDEFRLEPLEFYYEGDRVLVLGTLVTKGHEEGLASTVGQVWTLKDGKVTSVEGFLDSEEAIRAAGLTRLLI